MNVQGAGDAPQVTRPTLRMHQRGGASTSAASQGATVAAQVGGLLMQPPPVYNPHGAQIAPTVAEEEEDFEAIMEAFFASTPTASAQPNLAIDPQLAQHAHQVLNAIANLGLKDCVSNLTGCGILCDASSAQLGAAISIQTKNWLFVINRPNLLEDNYSVECNPLLSTSQPTTYSFSAHEIKKAAQLAVSKTNVSLKDAFQIKYRQRSNRKGTAQDQQQQVIDAYRAQNPTTRLLSKHDILILHSADVFGFSAQNDDPLYKKARENFIDYLFYNGITSPDRPKLSVCLSGCLQIEMQPQSKDSASDIVCRYSPGQEKAITRAQCTQIMSKLHDSALLTDALRDILEMQGTYHAIRPRPKPSAP